MKRMHAAFVSFPHPADVNPTLPLVYVMVRRGYQVTYVTSRRFADTVASLGARVVLCPEFRIEELLGSGGLLDEEREERRRYPYPHFELADRTLAAITPHFEKDRPNVVLYDFLAFAGRILASKQGIPAVKTNPSFALDSDHFALQVPDAQFREFILQSGIKIDRYFRSHGVPMEKFFFAKENLNIHFVPRALQPAGSVFDRSHFYAGRCAGEQVHYGDWRNTDDRPIALVSTSTTYIQGPEYFKMCIEALKDLPWRIILSIGDAGDARALGQLPDNVQVIQRTSLLKILAYTDVFISHGGLMSVSEALYHGVPLLVTSHGADELEWQGDIIEKLGVGKHLRKPDTNVETIRKHAIRLTEDAEISRAVARLRRAIVREPGPEETVNRIEEYLESDCKREREVLPCIMGESVSSGRS